MFKNNNELYFLYIYVLLASFSFSYNAYSDYFSVMGKMAEFEIKISDLRTSADACDQLAESQSPVPGDIVKKRSECNEFQSFMSTRYKKLETDLINAIEQAQSEKKSGKYNQKEWEKIQQSMRKMIDDLKYIRIIIRKH